ncbi:37S ribosomal protein MRP17 [Penicillium maclennaniae]|uniref:37S ribosomal protein MRP17 n=1 Tax=Penicillium maclennaniae TaxID=1343394 RepID=UPI002540141D|nr:37S ribosomal protein MRP17 [Penicillium maclennaniae]KAJ5677082.1 37S ribosomal protein MRP17 [Penicillium maclennaniae]
MIILIPETNVCDSANRSARAASKRFESTFRDSNPGSPLPQSVDQLTFAYRIARNAGVQVIRSGGVVRGFTNWGPFRLPRVTTKHQARYSEGHHFIMRFDASGPVQTSIRRTLGLDPRMINFSVVKLGDKLEEIKDIEGKVQWNKSRSITDTIQASRS